jgi:hypothetical protein
MPAAGGGGRNAGSQIRCRGALLAAVDEPAEMIEAGRGDKSQQVLEVLAALSWKADDEGRAQPDLGHQLAGPFQQA